MRPSGLLRSLLRPLRNPSSAPAPAWLLVGFILVYIYLIRYCQTHFYRDPTSFFFDPARGYRRYYSQVRQRQADAFIEQAEGGGGQQNAGKTSSAQTSPPPRMCVGIATVARENEQYVRATIGSLLEGLDANERAEIWLTVLIAHTTPTQHPVYREPWLTALADRVHVYNDDVNETQRAELQRWESERTYVAKAIFDYTYTLQKCIDTGAAWVAMVEDDTLAVTHWYPRALAALEQADDAHRRAPQTGDWLYLRMFFTEEFLGWNAEEWPTYLAASVGLALFVGGTLLLLRRNLPLSFLRTNTTSHSTITTTSTKKSHPSLLTTPSILLTTFLYLPLLITLYFLAGRQSISPLLKPGVSLMPRFGCCAQGLIFSSEMAPRILTHLREARTGFVDELIEAWANEHDMVRWVLAPSLLQHVGAHSSKGDDRGDKAKWDRSVAEKIWNFGFEGYDERSF